MAATHAAFASAELTNGATVLAAEQLYGSTATLLVQVFGANGVQTRFVDAYGPRGGGEEGSPARAPRIIIESISNPLLRVADIPAISEITRAAGAALIVDDTFGTPFLQRPLDLGADIVVHSATKYLSGHGDLTAGVVAAGPPYSDALEQLRKLVGGVLGPFEAWLGHRGLKTLPLRMGRQVRERPRDSGPPGLPPEGDGRCIIHPSKLIPIMPPPDACCRTRGASSPSSSRREAVKRPSPSSIP